MKKSLVGSSVLVSVCALLAACGTPHDDESAPGGAGSGGGGGSAPVTGDVDCSGHATSATKVKGAITQDQTWQGTVILSGSVTVQSNAKLTILPGTNLVMEADSELEIGWNGSAVTLQAEGTVDQPIRVCGKTAEPGYWSGFLVRQNVSSDSVISNMIVSDGGGKDAAVILEADLKVDNLSIKGSAKDGAWVTDFKENSRGLSVDGATGAAVVLLAPGAATRFPLGGQFDHNQQNVAKVRFTNIRENATFHDLGIVYVQENDIQVQDGATLTFDAGVQYLMSADTHLEIGWNSGDAEIQVNGTEADPVVMSGVTEDPGLWGALLIRNHVRTNSKLEHLKILHGGAGTEPALRLESPIAVKHVTLSTNKNGAWISAKGVAVGSSHLSVDNTDSYPLTVQPDALVSLPQGGTFSENQINSILVESGDFTRQGTISNLGVPYTIQGGFETKENSELTIAPGTTFLMAADSYIDVGWNSAPASVTAIGTAEAPIVFRGVGETAGYWQGLIVSPQVRSSSKFQYVQVLHAGGGDTNKAALKLRTTIDVKNCRFEKSAGYGILKRSDDGTDYATTNTFAEVVGSVGNL